MFVVESKQADCQKNVLAVSARFREYAFLYERKKYSKRKRYEDGKRMQRWEDGNAAVELMGDDG